MERLWFGRMRDSLLPPWRHLGRLSKAWRAWASILWPVIMPRWSGCRSVSCGDICYPLLKGILIAGWWAALVGHVGSAIISSGLTSNSLVCFIVLKWSLLSLKRLERDWCCLRKLMLINVHNWTMSEDGVKLRLVDGSTSVNRQLPWVQSIISNFCQSVDFVGHPLEKLSFEDKALPLQLICFSPLIFCEVRHAFILTDLQWVKAFAVLTMRKATPIFLHRQNYQNFEGWYSSLSSLSSLGILGSTSASPKKV